VRFWDASALTPALVDEVASREVRDLLAADARIAIWWGTPVEVASALARLRREGMLTDLEEATRLRDLGDLLAGALEMEPSAVVRELAMRLVRLHPLRAADAMQLSAAVAWTEGGAAGRQFVTLDDRLRQAAGREGFTVLP
jgi:predicted nucleic acid-binding protein